MPNTRDILTFVYGLFDKLLGFFSSFIALWDTQLRVLFSTSSVSNIPILGWVGDVVLDGFLGDLTLGGIALGSVSLLLVITLAKWLLR